MITGKVRIGSGYSRAFVMTRIDPAVARIVITRIAPETPDPLDAINAMFGIPLPLGPMFQAIATREGFHVIAFHEGDEAPMTEDVDLSWYVFS